MRTMSWYTEDKEGDDVARLQKVLIAQALLAGPADGRFDWRTRMAVVAFQARQGLTADGIVGPQTLAAIGQVNAPAPASTAQPPVGSSGQGRSVHIGLNGVNPAAYAGWPGTLGGCENDARKMAQIAQQEGFQARFLLTAAATSNALLGALKNAADALRSGDTFWLTYSGHGGQVPDTAEDDGKSETWVLYDRMVTDNELAAAFAQFQAGVNVIMVSDSCHSGSVFRTRNSLARLMPPSVVQALLARGWAARRVRPSQVLANGIALSACQDDQLAEEIGGAGVFTTQLVKTWDGGRYTGGYPTFLEHIAAAMPKPKDQTPQYGEFGANPAPLAVRTPFRLNAAAGRTATVAGTSVPATAVEDSRQAASVR